MNYDSDEQHCTECHMNYEIDHVHQYNDNLNTSKRYKSYKLNNQSKDTIELILEFGQDEKSSNSNISNIDQNQTNNQNQDIKNIDTDIVDYEQNINDSNKDKGKTLNFDNNYSYFTII